MKRVLICLMSLMILFSLSGCGERRVIDDEEVSMNELENVSMVIKEGTLTNASAVVVITDLEEHYVYGAWFRIDEKVDGNWVELEPIVDDYGFVDLGYLVNQNNTLELKHDWEDLYGKLDAGEYRLVKSVYNQKEIFFSVEFKID